MYNAKEILFEMSDCAKSYGEIRYYIISQDASESLHDLCVNGKFENAEIKVKGETDSPYIICLVDISETLLCIKADIDKGEYSFSFIPYWETEVTEIKNTAKIGCLRDNISKIHANILLSENIINSFC